MRSRYQLKITLRDVSPLVWRRVLIRSDSSIAQLHDTVQIAMGWEDMHLHQFRVHGKAYGVERECGITFSDNPHRVTLADFKLRKGEKFVYEYDMGDFWEHDIRLEQALSLDDRKRYPVCIAGGGDCPPEDCGGPPGYAEFLFQRGSWPAVNEVYEAIALVAERVRDWRQGGPRPAEDDAALDDAMERMNAWLDEAPMAFSRRTVNAALREKSEEWACTSAST